MNDSRFSHGAARPRILDLYCKQGGAGKGYSDAGFEVVGVDIEDQPRYPFEFHRMDALDVLFEIANGNKFWRFDGVHASPPCQPRSKGQRIQGNEHTELVPATRELLEQTGLPYIIENVPGPTGDPEAELRDPIMLCGTMFGLPLYRHRLFEIHGFECPEPLHGQHYLKQVKMGRKPGPDEIIQPVGNFSGVEQAREAMGMPWATRDGLREAIPPAYCEYIGGYLLAELERRTEERVAV